MPSRIEDYGLIGNCESAAMVSRNGSIDWLSLPRFDSAACFAALPKETMTTGGTTNDDCCNGMAEANQIMTTSNGGSMIQAATMVIMPGHYR